jgi:transposase
MPVWSGQRVERTNARGRHKYCAPFKAWIVEQAMRPGVSMAGLAMRNQINANQLRRWVQLHGKRTGSAAVAARLVPVTIVSQNGLCAEASAAQRPWVEIVVAGAVVRVRDDTAPVTLRMVLQALRGTTA